MLDVLRPIACILDLVMVGLGFNFSWWLLICLALMGCCV